MREGILFKWSLEKGKTAEGSSEEISEKSVEGSVNGSSKERAEGSVNESCEEEILWRGLQG